MAGWSATISVLGAILVFIALTFAREYIKKHLVEPMMPHLQSAQRATWQWFGKRWQCVKRHGRLVLLLIAITGIAGILIFLALIRGELSRLAQRDASRSVPPEAAETAEQSVDASGATTKKRVAVVASLSGPDSKASKEIVAAVKLAWRDAIADCPGLDAVTLDVIDDRGDAAFARERARSLAEDAGVVAVIGHFSSSITEEALNEYCRENPVPIVMPVPTASGITATAATRGCLAVLRLPPSNERQGRDAAAAMGLLPAKRDATEVVSSVRPERYIVIFRDQSNPVYSNNLGRELIAALKLDSSPPGDISGDFRVLMDRAVGGDDSGIIITDSMPRLGPVHSVVLVGMTDTALQTLRQAKKMNWRPDYVIMTDGAVSEDIVRLGDDVLDDRVFLLFQVPEVREGTRASDLYKRINLAREEISYAPYGYDAARLVAKALDIASGQGGVNRATVGSVMTKWKSHDSVRQVVNGPWVVSEAGYEFDELGNAVTTRYHVYRYNQELKKFTYYADPSSGQQR